MLHWPIFILWRTEAGPRGVGRGPADVQEGGGKRELGGVWSRWPCEDGEQGRISPKAMCDRHATACLPSKQARRWPAATPLGLTWWEEVNTYGTDPTQWDTDGDGMDDGWEANNGLSPTNPGDGIGDPDNDNLINSEEYAWQTDPQKADTDGDEMDDGYEVDCGVSNGGWQDPTVVNNRYAVLISRRTAADSNFDEFWNDLRIMYDILVDDYGYVDDNTAGFNSATDHVAVLYADGTDVTSGAYAPPTGTTITDLSATTTNIEAVFTDLSTVMTDNDLLFVFIFDHGSYVDQNSNGMADLGEPVILCAQNGNIRDDDFSTNYVGLVQHYARRVFVMQQCFSGGFVEDLSNPRTVIVTAARGDETAGRADDSPNQENENVAGVSYHHGEFLYHFQSAMRGETPQGGVIDADTDNNGYISIEEAYIHMDSNESGSETPQLDDDGNGQSQQDGDGDDGVFAGNTYI